MSQVCINCSTAIEGQENENHFITNGICSQCVESIFDQQDNSLTTFLDNIETPILLMQPDPRQVRTANKKACDLFEKELTQIEGYRGGQVFDCVHAFTVFDSDKYREDADKKSWARFIEFLTETFN